MSSHIQDYNCQDETRQKPKPAADVPKHKTDLFVPIVLRLHASHIFYYCYIIIPYYSIMDAVLKYHRRIRLFSQLHLLPTFSSSSSSSHNPQRMRMKQKKKRKKTPCKSKPEAPENIFSKNWLFHLLHVNSLDAIFFSLENPATSWLLKNNRHS